MSRTARIGLVVAVVALAVVAFIVLKPDGGAEKVTPGSGAPSTTTSPSAPGDHAMEPVVARVTVRDGAPVGGVADVTAIKGQTVRIGARSDAAGALHVHGYNLIKQVPAGGAAKISFPAKIEGVFEIEFHVHHGQAVEIAKLKVKP